MTRDNVRRVFQRILTREAGAGPSAPAIASAARRACEHLAEELTPLIGDGGVAAICARSLHLTQQNFPGLGRVHAPAQGESPFALLQLSLAQQKPADGIAAAIALLATVCELLTLFIGESLTDRLLSEAWPGDFPGDTEETVT